MSQVPIPSVGRICHYYSSESAPLAAIIAEVHDLTVVWDVTLYVLDVRQGVASYIRAPYAATPTERHWSWPPRIPPVSTP